MESSSIAPPVSAFAVIERRAKLRLLFSTVRSWKLLGPSQPPRRYFFSQSPTALRKREVAESVGLSGEEGDRLILDRCVQDLA